MIYDRLDRLEEYRGLSPALDTAIDYLCAIDPSRLSEGRHAVDGEKVFVLSQSYDTKDPAGAKYEAHRKYVDIQIVLDGEERCGYAPFERLGHPEPWNEEKDIGFFADPSAGEVLLPLVPGVFAMFFPGDGHKPACDPAGGKRRIRKIVVKAAV